MLWPINNIVINLKFCNIKITAENIRNHFPSPSVRLNEAYIRHMVDFYYHLDIILYGQLDCILNIVTIHITDQQLERSVSFRKGFCFNERWLRGICYNECEYCIATLGPNAHLSFLCFQSNESLTMMRKMYDNHHIIFSEKTDNETLNDYVYKEGYVFVRDRPAINHLIYNDYILRKKINPNDERKQCPFATAKDPFMKRRRSFAYQLGSELNSLFDSEYVLQEEFTIFFCWAHK